MSDEMVTLPRRRVMRDEIDKLYHVWELSGIQWEAISKGYSHSTSAYAKLGRLTQQDTLKKTP